MFAYFRNQNRRDSTPASPASRLHSPSLSSHAPAWPPLDPPPAFANGSSPASRTDSPISPLPPVLPPIPRIASTSDRRKEDAPHHASDTPLPPVPAPRPSDPARARALPPHGHQDEMLERPGSALGWAPPVSEPPHHAPPAHGMQKLAASQPSISPSSSAYTLLPRAAGSSSNLSSTAEGPLARFSSQPTGSHHANRQSKSKLNLLNPVSLLMRRRSSQAADPLGDGSTAKGRAMDYHVNRLVQENDFQPIKGHIVHDFNAPRKAWQPSSAEREEATEPSSASSLESIENQSGTPTSLPERSHFIEDFSDSTTDQGNVSALQREGLVNQAFLARASRQFEAGDKDLPPIPTRTPPAVPAEAPRSNDRGSKDTLATAPRESTDQSTVRSSTSRGTRGTHATSPESSPTRMRRSTSLDGLQREYSFDLPRHMTSTASRTSKFSFQMHSESSKAEEQALEERHKRSKHAQKESVADSRFDELEEEDYSAYDDIMDDVDDDIPYLGGDDDDDDINDEPFANFSATYPAAAGLSSMTLDSLAKPQSTWSSNTLRPAPASGSQEVTPKAKPVGRGIYPDRTPTKASKISDDLYFDDGDVDADSEMDHGTFDESVFDTSPKQFKELAAAQRSALSAHAEEGETPQTTGKAPSAGSSDPASQPATTSGLLRETGPGIDSSSVSQGDLNAYHSALASAAVKAESEGRFSRQASTLAGSSNYDVGSPDQLGPPTDDLFGVGPDSFDDYDDYEMEDDPIIAAANAEALAADDAGFYGQEFGFYKNGGGEMFNGGYWGSASEGRMIGNAVMEPNLTPITERSEFSNRNSFVSLHAHSNSNHMSHAPSWDAQNPGLKDIAASLSMDDDDGMSLSQLMRLRKEAFSGQGSSRNSFTFPSAGPVSATSSPAAVANSSPGATVPSSLALELDTTQHRYLEKATNDFGYGDDDDGGDDCGYDSPNSPTITTALSGHRATPSITESPRRSGASSTIPSASSTKSRRAWQDVPVLKQPRPASQRGSKESVDAAPAQDPQSPPMPSSEMMQKFAARPPADAYRRTSYGQNRSSHHYSSSGPDKDTVTYVQENADWYLERRRTLSTGEVVVVGRELVEGGRI